MSKVSDVLTFDYIIVGGGSAGCVLANRLSADARTRVLLIEAGPRDTNPWIHIPVGYFKTMHNPRTDWCLRAQPDAGINGRSLSWPRGKVLGGSSSINGLLYIRGQSSDFDQWRQLGCTGWSYEDVLPFFMASENQERGADGFHGAGGPLSVSDMRIRRDICDAYIEAASHVGIPRNSDFNGKQQEGAGYFQLTARNGWRCSAAVAFLHPARHRRNLLVFTNAQARQIILEGRRAVGLAFRHNGVEQRALAGREIILSAGAVHSPQLLALSGIGPAAQLAKAGITVLQDAPGVGENLQDHLQARCVYASTRPTLNNEVNNPLLKLRIGLEYALFRRGPMSMGASQVAIFARSSPGLDTPDIQFHIQPLSSDEPGKGLHSYAAFTASVCQLRPESRGRIVTATASADDPPLIYPNYLATKLDQDIAVAGLRLARRLTQTPPLDRFVKAELLPGKAVESDSDYLAFIRQNATTIYHPVGTCKMGTDAMAVVDPRLRVIGLVGLRVADASIMPTLVSGNTNAAAIMIGEKASAMILEDARA